MTATAGGASSGDGRSTAGFRSGLGRRLPQSSNGIAEPSRCTISGENSWRRRLHRKSFGDSSRDFCSQEMARLSV